MRSLKDAVVLVTGASRGIGVDMARAFGARGARLALAARSADDLEKVRASLAEAGFEAVAVPTDMKDLDSLRRLVDRVTSELGPVDILVNNAGIGEVYDFESIPPEAIASVIQVNVTGLLWLTRLVAPSMVQRGRGHIVNIASLAGLTSMPHHVAYAASKHAVVGASRALRGELRDHGIGVSVVCPGYVNAGMVDRWEQKAPGSAGMVTSDEVAKAVVDAVLKDRAEVVVTHGLSKIAAVVQVLAPNLTLSIMERMGVLKYMRWQAKSNVERGDPFAGTS